MNRTFDPQQALFYGEFVAAVYAMFDSNPHELHPQPQNIPDGYEVGAWIHMSDFFLETEIPKFYGMVAHKVDDPQSRVIAIRGTEGKIEWFDDAAAIPVPFHQTPSAGRVAHGFDRIYKTLKVVKRPKSASQRGMAASAVPEVFSGSFVEQLEQLALSREAELRIQKAPGAPRPPRETVVAAHSLGGALATLFVMENDAKRKFDMKGLYTFASPRVGNLEFVHLFNQLGIESWRIFNPKDIVPKLPPHIPVLLDYAHVDTPYELHSEGLAKENIVCCHVMDSYLHCLDINYPLRQECVVPAAVSPAPTPASSSTSRLAVRS